MMEFRVEWLQKLRNNWIHMQPQTRGKKIHTINPNSIAHPPTIHGNATGRAQVSEEQSWEKAWRERENGREGGGSRLGEGVKKNWHMDLTA